MSVVKELTWYVIYHVKYLNKYLIVHRELDSLDGQADSLPEALALGESLDYSLSRFITDNDNE